MFAEDCTTGIRIRFWCGACRHEADAVLRPGARKWSVGSFSNRCPGGRACLLALAETLPKKPEPWRLLHDPRPYVAVGPIRAERSFDSPPSRASIDGWHAALLTSDAPLDYLLDQRGLTIETIKRFELGWDKETDAITIPISDERHELHNVKRRYLAPARDPKITGLRRPAELYPIRVLEANPLTLVVAEGEFDCLLLNQHGIAAITSTAGTTWKREWDRHVFGRRVAVLYDAGDDSFEKAERRAGELLAAGARDAWPVDLSRAGFAPNEDVTDWFCKYGRSSVSLRRLISASRHRAKEIRR